jgi:hypothetical protein
LRRLTVFLFLLLAAPAHAALGESPFESLPGAGTCLRGTATPRTFALLGPLGRTSSATDLRTVGSPPAARVRLGALVDCAAVAVDPGGAAVMAGAVSPAANQAEVRVAVRDPGGAFGAPVRLGAAPVIDSSVRAAVSPSGSAAVAWVQRRGDVFAEHAASRIVVARRAPGGAFGPPESLSGWRRGDDSTSPASVAVGIDAAGNVTVAWSRPRRGTSGLATAAVAHAAPAARFAVQQLIDSLEGSVRTTLAVAPDGWTVLAYADLGEIRAYERPPDGAGFTSALRPVEGGSPAVAVRDGGGALIAWRSFGEDLSAGVLAAVRTAAGPLGKPEEVAPTVSSFGSFGGAFYVVTASTTYPPTDDGNAALKAALAPDGRALLAWGADGERTSAPVTAHVAVGTLGSGFGPPQRLGGPVRDVNGVAPLFLPDGRAALAWTDNTGGLISQNDGRLHLAIDDAPLPPDPPAPALRVTAAAHQRLFASQAPAVAVRCAAACDLRASLRWPDGDSGAITRTLRGRRTVRLQLAAPDDDAHRRLRVRVLVTATAPGGHGRVTVSRHLVVVRRPAPPVAAPLGVETQRRGRLIVVTWHTAFPARRMFFYVVARRTRAISGDPSGAKAIRGRGRSRFRVRMRVRDPQAVHWVWVIPFGVDNGETPAPVRVRIS